MKLMISLIMTLFIFSSTANALIYVEPLAGLSRVSYDTGSLDSENNFVVGGRLGFSALLFTLGGEYTNVDSTGRTAIFAAFKAPVIPLRAFGRYFTDTGITGDSSGYGLGVGFTGLPFLSINLDYNHYESDDSLLKLNEIMLSVSMPFDFL